MLVNADVERKRAWSRKSYHKCKTTPENLVRFLWSHAKRRALTKGVPFEIEHSDIVVPDVCPIMGIPFTVRGINVKTSASVDRIVPELGYVKGNIRVISTQANRMKWDSTPEELESFCVGMLRELGKAGR